MADQVTVVSSLNDGWASGALTSTTKTVAMGAAPVPATATLKSSDAGRKIELSTDGGVEFFTPTLDVTSTTMQVLYIRAPVSHIKFTGAIGDTWSIR